MACSSQIPLLFFIIWWSSSKPSTSSRSIAPRYLQSSHITDLTFTTLRSQVMFSGRSVYLLWPKLCDKIVKGRQLSLKGFFLSHPPPFSTWQNKLFSFAFDTESNVCCGYVKPSGTERVKNCFSSGYPARCLVLLGQQQDWLTWCQYTVTMSEQVLQFLSQCGRICTFVSRSTLEIHCILLGG